MGRVFESRKETEKNGRELREVLVKKGCKEGGVSL
nr:glycosyltransferase [Capnocytophaga sp. oral taxon 335]